MDQRSLRRTVAATLATTGALAMAIWARRDRPQDDPEVTLVLPARVDAPGWSASPSCRACHPAQHHTWDIAWHRRMTQEATPALVAAPFDGRLLQKGRLRWRVLTQDGKLYAEELDPDTSKVLERSRVVMTTGSHHLQAYWIEGEDERMEQLPFVYLVDQGRWIANDDSFLHPEPEDPSESPSPAWSDGCVNCHTTAPQLAAPPAGANPDERAVVELGIGCEACHGPAQAHARAQRSPLARYARHLGLRPGSQDVVHPANLDHERASALCGRCHSQTTLSRSRDVERTLAFRPGQLYSDYADLEDLRSAHTSALLTEPDLRTQEQRDAIGSMWPDGAVRVAGREYNGTASSACSTRGAMSCLSCHSLHTRPTDKHLRPDRPGQDACLSCHAAQAQDIPAHTHHAPGSAGSDCLNCHMPYATYGLLKATRQHLIDSPTDSGADTRERPNACNLCHLDQTLAWTQGHLARWYGQTPRELGPDLSALHQQVAAGALWMLRGDAAQRAIAAWHVSWPPSIQARTQPQAMTPLLIALLEDPYAAVRHIAWSALQALGQATTQATTQATALPYVHDLPTTMSAQDARAALRAQATDAWLSQAQALPAMPALLLAPQGQPEQARWAAIKAQRDDSPLSISE